jgi:hypothetical protein
VPATQASSTTRFTITGTGTSATYTVMAGWVKRRQCEVIDYLKEEKLYY